MTKRLGIALGLLGLILLGGTAGYVLIEGARPFEAGSARFSLRSR